MRSEKEQSKKKKRQKHINFEYIQQRYFRDINVIRSLKSDYDHEGGNPIVAIIIGFRYLWRINGAKKSQFYISWFENNNKLTGEQESSIRKMKRVYKAMLKVA